MEAKRCCERVYGGGRMLGGYPCAKKAKVERGGAHYCTVHDPVRVKEKIDARAAVWEAQWKKEQIEREEAAVLKAEMQRRYDCHDALVEALELLLHAEGEGTVCNIDRATCWAAVAKAKGETP